MIFESDYFLVLNTTVDKIHKDGTKTKLFDYKKGDWCNREVNGEQVHYLQINSEKNGLTYKLLFGYVGEDVEDIAIKEFEALAEDFKKRIVNFI